MRDRIAPRDETTISVVMTTFNGERYVREQLESIYLQTRAPSEVIICDDRSTDATADMVKQFIVERGLSSWQLFINHKNLGWQRNFFNAMRRATGDIIFLCDQDDIWYSDKIEVMTHVMTQERGMLCLSGRIMTIDQHGRSTSDPGFPAGGASWRVEKREFSRRFNTTVLLGCTLSFRREIAEVIARLGVDYYSHDEQVCRLAALLDGLYILDRPVLKYRIHSSNASGISSGSGPGAGSNSTRTANIRANMEWLEAVIERSPHGAWPKRKLHILRKSREMQQARLRFLSTRRFRDYFGLLRFLPYYSGLFMFLGDFAYAWGLQKHAARLLRRLPTATD